MSARGECEDVADEVEKHEEQPEQEQQMSTEAATRIPGLFPLIHCRLLLHFLFCFCACTLMAYLGDDIPFTFDTLIN